MIIRRRGEYSEGGQPTPPPAGQPWFYCSLDNTIIDSVTGISCRYANSGNNAVFAADPVIPGRMAIKKHSASYLVGFTPWSFQDDGVTESKVTLVKELQAGTVNPNGPAMANRNNNEGSRFEIQVLLTQQITTNATLVGSSMGNQNANAAAWGVELCWVNNKIQLVWRNNSSTYNYVDCGSTLNVWHRFTLDVRKTSGTSMAARMKLHQLNPAGAETLLGDSGLLNMALPANTMRNQFILGSDIHGNGAWAAALGSLYKECKIWAAGDVAEFLL